MAAFFWQFWVLFAVALVCSSMGFKKYIWFISIGYGFAVAGIGLASLILFNGDLCTTLYCIVLFLYGCRLGGYLLFRELKLKSYNKNMVGEVKDGKGMKFYLKVALWLSCALLYLCETAPVFYRLANGIKSDALTWIGLIITIGGICLESASDLQKAQQKKVNPNRFCDTGLFKLVRCPNYLGEMLIWTGVFVSGLTALKGVGQWIIALLGYLGIIYIMFSGARRLEIRQDKRYGEDPEYQKYKNSTPIMVPFVHLYSVKKYTWLVG